MSGRGDRDRDYGRGGPPPDYYRGGPPPPFAGGGSGAGEYYGAGPGMGGYGNGGGGAGGGPGFHHGRDFRDSNRGPPPNIGGRGGPPPQRFMDRGGGGPPPRGGGYGPPPPNNGNGRRRPPPPGIPIFRSYEEEREWVEDRRRKRLARPSKFDVMPSSENNATAGFPPSIPPPAINTYGNADMMSNEMRNNMYSQNNNSQPMMSPPMDHTTLPQQTRHARRLYVGNLPPQITEEQIHRVFRDAIKQALVIPTNGEQLPFNIEEDPILSVYINHERRFCFLEFKSVELCSACMALDGLEVVKGQPPVKVKRPNDYNASIAPKPLKLPELDVSRLGIISSTVLDGPNKIFIGGLHYHMQESQVLELLQAFGKVKAFHLVKNDPDSHTSKGYCFVEYADHSLTPTVVANLNGMDIGGGKSITARLAGERNGTVAPILSANNATLVPVPPIVQAQQLQQQMQMTGMGQPPGVAPDRNIVNGYDVELLVDAALGKCPMPTAPTHFDSFGQPLTRIAQIIPQPITVPALTPQQQMAINALPTLSALPPLQPVTGLPPMNGIVPVMGLPPLNSLPPLINNIPTAPSTIPALTPEQQAAINALSLIPGLSAIPTQNPPPSSPTRVLVLLNMVTDEDLATEEDHAALVDEIKEECMKYGSLRTIQVPRKVQGLVELSAIRKVFLEYNSIDDAVKAETELSGRQFGQNVVVTMFFPEADFAAGRLR